MPLARLFNVRNCQTVRLPKGISFRGPEIEVFRRGDELILREKYSSKPRHSADYRAASSRQLRSRTFLRPR
jgi:virulence-associated protein VagC